MDSGESKELIVSIFRKYRWAAVVLLSGLLLMLLPQGRNREQAEPQTEPVGSLSVQQELEQILLHLEGAGKVKVLLTEESGEEVHFQENQKERRSPDSTERQTDTVMVTSSDRNEGGLIRRTDPPVYRGAVVLCQGADSAQIRLAVVDAVATATGLTADRISVWKMK